MRSIALGFGAWFFTAATAAAFPCTNPKLPWDTVVCGNAELQKLADERLKAFQAATARLGPQDAQRLREEQSAWVRSYSASCGIHANRPPPSPIPAELVECFKRAGMERLAYLQAYAPDNTAAKPSSAEDIRDYTGPFTTKALYTMCSRNDPVSRDKCNMYTQGLMYGLRVSHSIQDRLQICLPKISAAEARTRILQFVDATTSGKPETNGDGGDWMAFMALSSGNICKEAAKPKDTFDDPVVGRATGINTANDLYHHCKAPNNSPPKVACVTYIQAFNHTYRIMVERKLTIAVICPRTDLSIADELSLFQTYAANNPDLLGVSAAQGLLAVLSDNSPCDTIKP